MGGKGEAWHRRHALSLVSQLPENAEDAAIVLAYMRDLVEDFLVPDRQPGSALGARAALAGLRLVEPAVKLHAKAPPLAIVEPIEGEPRDDSD